MHRTLHHVAPLALALAFLAGCTDATTAPTLKPIDATHLYAVGDEPPPPPSNPAPVASSDTVVTMESEATALAADLESPASGFGGVLATPTDGGIGTFSAPLSGGLDGLEVGMMHYPLPTCDITAADE